MYSVKVKGNYYWVKKASMIKKLGTIAREDIEKFLQQKIFLQLFVKVKPKWRDNELQLKEYGY